MLEKDIVNDILKYLREHGCWAEKMHGGPFMRVGIPDILMCIPYQKLSTNPGLFVAIEVKQPGKKPTPVQVQCIEEIRAAGGVAFVATSVEDVKRELPWLN